MSQNIQEIRSQNAPAPIGPYSQAICCNGFIFVSGQLPLNPATSQVIPGDIEAQARQVFTNLKAILAEADSSLQQVVRTTIYLLDLADFAAVNELYTQTFTSDPKPARVTVQAAALPMGVGIEIDAIATVG